MKIRRWGVFALVLWLAFALTACKPASTPVTPPQAVETTAQAGYATAATHVTYRWQTYAWSGHQWLKTANLLQHNEWGSNFSRVPRGATVVLDGTAAWPVSFLKAHNVKGVIRYIAGGGSWKHMGRSEYRSYVAAKIAVGFCWEGGATALEGGYSAGVAAARSSQAALGALGASKTAPVYFACDFEASGNDPAIHRFLDGAASVLGKQRVGLYAGIGPLRYNIPFGASYDLDINIAQTADWGQEGYVKPAPPKPVPAGHWARVRATYKLRATVNGKTNGKTARKGGEVFVDNVRGAWSYVHWGGGSGWIPTALLKAV